MRLLPRCERKRLILPRQEWRDTPYRDATVRSLGTWIRDFQIVGAIALGREVLRWHPELLTKHQGDRFRATIRKRQIVDVRTDRIGVAFDQKHFAWVDRNRSIDAIS